LCDDCSTAKDSLHLDLRLSGGSILDWNCSGTSCEFATVGASGFRELARCSSDETGRICTAKTGKAAQTMTAQVIVQRENKRLYDAFRGLMS